MNTSHAVPTPGDRVAYRPVPAATVERVAASGRRAALFTAVAAVLSCLFATNVQAAPAATNPAGTVDPTPVAAMDETAPVKNDGDAADDPAIWVHPTKPSRSVIVGNDRPGAIEVYDLSGRRIQRVETGRYTTNVDVRQQVTIAGYTRDVVATTHGGIRFYAMDQSTRLLTEITDTPLVNPYPDGLCLYHDGYGRLFVFVTRELDGSVRQYQVTDDDRDGRLGITLLRTFDVGSGAEACAADDENAALYVSEEDVALWRYDASPTGDTSRTAVDTTSPDGRLAADVEGVTVVSLPGGGGYVIVSAQNVADPANSYFAVYRRSTPNTFVTTFRVVAGYRADGCQRTDGIVAHAGFLGGHYPQGLFVCQDDANTSPGSEGNQNYKLTRLDDVVDLGEQN